MNRKNETSKVANTERAKSIAANPPGRLDALMAGANASGFTIDYLEALTAGLSRQARDKLLSNAAALPEHMKLTDNPHVRRGNAANQTDFTPDDEARLKEVGEELSTLITRRCATKRTKEEEARDRVEFELYTVGQLGELSDKIACELQSRVTLIDLAATNEQVTPEVADAIFWAIKDVRAMLAGVVDEVEAIKRKARNRIELALGSWPVYGRHEYAVAVAGGEAMQAQPSTE